MEWKKEKISSSELERRQREYMNAAMSMVKRSHAASEPPAVSVPAPEEKPAPVAEQKPVPEPEPVEKPEPEPIAEPEPVAESTNEPGPAAEKSPAKDNYGVYTADELLAAPSDSAGMKKATEILEEMTKNTEFMRKLADDEGEPGTTDFPKFEDCMGGERFREEESTDKDDAPRGDE